MVVEEVVVQLEGAGRVAATEAARSSPMGSLTCPARQSTKPPRIIRRSTIWPLPQRPTSATTPGVPTPTATGRLPRRRRAAERPMPMTGMLSTLPLLLLLLLLWPAATDKNIDQLAVAINAACTETNFEQSVQAWLARPPPPLAWQSSCQTT